MYIHIKCRLITSNLYLIPYMVLKPLYITFLVAFIAFTGCGKKSKDKAPGKTGADQPALQVEVITARVDTGENILITTGTILANEEVDIRSEIPGMITAIYFTEGSHVNKGQVLVRIDDRELRAELQKSLLDKKLLEEKEIRQKRLLEIQAISQEEYDASLNDLQIVQANISMLQ